MKRRSSFTLAEFAAIVAELAGKAPPHRKMTIRKRAPYVELLLESTRGHEVVCLLLARPERRPEGEAAIRTWAGGLYDQIRAAKLKCVEIDAGESP